MLFRREDPCIRCGGHQFSSRSNDLSKADCYDCHLARRSKGAVATTTATVAEPPTTTLLVYDDLSSSEDESSSASASASEAEAEQLEYAYVPDYGVDPENFSSAHRDRSDDDSELPRGTYRPKACLYCHRNRQEGVVVTGPTRGKAFQTCCKPCRDSKGKCRSYKHSKDCDREEYVDVWSTPGLDRDSIEGFTRMAQTRWKRRRDEDGS